LSKNNALQINTFIFSKNLHNPEVPGSNPGLATKPLKKPNDSHSELSERLWVNRTKEEVDVVDNPIINWLYFFLKILPINIYSCHFNI
jgi:hypothetical protein